MAGVGSVNIGRLAGAVAGLTALAALYLWQRKRAAEQLSGCGCAESSATSVLPQTQFVAVAQPCLDETLQLSLDGPLPTITNGIPFDDGSKSSSLLQEKTEILLPVKNDPNGLGLSANEGGSQIHETHIQDENNSVSEKKAEVVYVVNEEIFGVPSDTYDVDSGSLHATGGVLVNNADINGEAFSCSTPIQYGFFEGRHSRYPCSVDFGYYDFYLPSDLCGRFIGRNGKRLEETKKRSGASVVLRDSTVRLNAKHVFVFGSSASINAALIEIRARFPLAKYPELSLLPARLSSNSTVNLLPSSCATNVFSYQSLSLPLDTDVTILITASEGPTHHFLQMPTNSSYVMFVERESLMRDTYARGTSHCIEAPGLPSSILREGLICVVIELPQACYRAMITRVIDADYVQVKYVDYGGFDIVHVSRLRQIRSDFLNIPFQAVEVLLFGVEALYTIDAHGSSRYSLDALKAIQDFVDKAVSLTARLVSRVGESSYVLLFARMPNGESLSLSDYLTNLGYVQVSSNATSEFSTFGDNERMVVGTVTESSRSGQSTLSLEPRLSPADFPALPGYEKQ